MSPRADRFSSPDAAPADPPPDAPPAGEATPEQKPPAPPVYRVAPGKTLQCRRGTLAEGDLVEARDVDGPEHLEELVAAAAVVKA
jgi:hypothetical protein